MNKNTFRITILAAAALMLLTLRPAHAQYWDISYEAVGATTETASGLSTSVPWPLSPVPGSGGWLTFYPEQPYFTAASGSGAISVVCTWVPSVDQPTAPAQKLSVFAEAELCACSVNPPATVKVWDSWGDSDNCTDYAPFSPGGIIYLGGPIAYAKGFHWLKETVTAGTHRVVFPAIGLNAIVTECGGMCGNAFVRFRASLADLTVEAWSTDRPADWDALQPRYLSGTNCKIRGRVTLPPGSSGIAEATLSVGNEVATRYTPSTPDYEPILTTTFAAAFDSTHFADSTNLPLRLWVRERDDTEHVSTISAPAKNRALLLGNSADPYLAAVVPSLLESLGSSAVRMKHSVLSSQTDGKTTILGRLPIYTTFFIDTHGNVRGFSDCTMTQQNSAWSNWLPAKNDPGYDIESSVAQKSANQPAYNFVFVQACEGAGTTGLDLSTSIASAFGVEAIAEDRAFLAWRYEMSIASGNPEWIKRYWEELAKGENVVIAWILSSSVAPPIGEYVRGNLSTYGPVSPTIIGDRRAKLHGVYGLRGLVWSQALEDVQ